MLYERPKVARHVAVCFELHLRQIRLRQVKRVSHYVFPEIRTEIRKGLDACQKILSV